MDFDYDVCIIGGGPAGVISAIGIAKEGYSCVIVDKKARDKIGNKNCGDALAGNHIDILADELGIDPPDFNKNEASDNIRKVTIATNGITTKLTSYYPGTLVERLNYAQRLLSLAEEYGAKILSKTKVRGIIVEDDYIRGVKIIDSKRKETEIRAKFTIDASGVIGALRSKLPENFKDGLNYDFSDKCIVRCYREIVELKNDHNFDEEIVLIYDKHIPMPGYNWIFSKGKRKLNMGICWMKDIPYPQGKSLIDLYHDTLDRYFSPDEYIIINSGGGLIPYRPVFDNLVFNGALLVGDAGALVDPTTYEGHGPALESGRLAAKAINEALKRNDFSKHALWQYNVDVMKYPGGLHAQSYLANRLLKKIGVDSLEYLLKRELLKEQELIDLFQDPDAEFTFFWKVKKMIKAFPKWGTMIQIARYTAKIEKMAGVYLEYPNRPEDLAAWIVKRDKIYKFSI